MEPLAEYLDGLPNLCGQEPLIGEAIAAGREYPVFPHDADIQHAASTFAVALHMHQPLIPAGGGLRSEPVISNLAWMMDHQDVGDDHNAPVFVWCYKRMGEFIRQLLDEGRQPRVMLDYSGTLLHGMRQMGLDDIFDALGYLTRDPRAFYLLACETSCYRYWGQGTWTDYGAELARRASKAASSPA
jgi:hypothetical protein